MLKRYLDAVWINRVFLSMVFTTPKREQAVFEPIWAEFTAEGIYLYTFLKKRSEQNEVKSHLVIAAADVISAATSGYIQRVLYDAPEDWVAARDMFVSNLLEVLFGGIE